MANTTRTRPRTQTPRGRFPRPAASQTRRTPPRPRIPSRRPQKPSGLQGMISKLPGLSSAGKSSGGNKGKVGAAALFAGAAGFAMRNRDKLPFGRKRSGTEPPGAPPER
jgi:hypothetical protein